jgi:transcriptional regulator with XRE-family HTH domain
MMRFEPARLRELMERNGIENPNQLAVQVGFGKDDPGRWLKGMEPSIQNLFQLAIFFRVSPAYFYALPESHSKPKQAEGDSLAAISIDLIRYALGAEHAEILEAFGKANLAGKKMLLAAARSLIR